MTGAPPFSKTTICSCFSIRMLPGMADPVKLTMLSENSCCLADRVAVWRRENGSICPFGVLFFPCFIVIIRQIWPIWNLLGTTILFVLFGAKVGRIQPKKLILKGKCPIFGG